MFRPHCHTLFSYSVRMNFPMYYLDPSNWRGRKSGVTHRLGAVSCSYGGPVYASDLQYSTCSLLLLLVGGGRAGIYSIWVRILCATVAIIRTVPVYSRAERTHPEYYGMLLPLFGDVFLFVRSERGLTETT